MKFNTILLTEYQRVIFMDSDGMANGNLDHLFFISFPEKISLAAPIGYWFGKNGMNFERNSEYCLGDISNAPELFGVITSVLLVVDPNEELFDKLKEYFGKWMNKNGQKSRQYFDMDIINQRLACHGELLVLPKHYGTLNSEYLNLPEQKLAKVMEPCKNFEDVKFMHFSGLGKPWSHTLSSYAQKYEKDARPFVEKWFKYGSELCPQLVKS